MSNDRTVIVQPDRAPANRNIVDKGADAVDDVLDAPTRFVTAPEKRRYKHKMLQPGSVIKNRFLLESEIGRGGMGVVYTARDLVQEGVGGKASLIAIKLLSEEFKQHPEALLMLQKECKKAQSLAHPNIGTVYDFDRDEGNVYMTMELLSGCSLQAYLKEHQYKQISYEKVIAILSEIVAGLEYAHRRNIIHSDLKPANIFLTKNGAKIFDFGIARAMKDTEVSQVKVRHQQLPGEDSENSSEKSDNTVTEVFIALTPSYASLEMFKGEPPDVRDDIYGLACIVYELLAGKHPYGRRPANEAFAKQMIPKRVEGLKDWQWNALLKGLALRREERVGSATEFLESLRPKRKEPWKLASYFLAFVAVVSVGYFFMAPDKIVEPSLFDKPPPAAVLSETQQENVNDILEVAEVHMMVGRLVSPPGGNALEEYRKVLELNAYNRSAIAGLTALLARLAQQVETSIESDDVKQAAELVEIGLQVNNKHERLLTLQQRVNAARH